VRIAPVAGVTQRHHGGAVAVLDQQQGAAIAAGDHLGVGVERAAGQRDGRPGAELVAHDRQEVTADVGGDREARSPDPRRRTDERRLVRVGERPRRCAAVDVDQHQIRIQRTVAGGEHRDGPAGGCKPRTRVKPGSAAVDQPMLTGSQGQAPEIEIHAARAV
jgi:hypothetical protein